MTDGCTLHKDGEQIRCKKGHVMAVMRTYNTEKRRSELEIECHHCGARSVFAPATSSLPNMKANGDDQ